MKKRKILIRLFSIIIIIIFLFTIQYFIHKKDIKDIENIEIKLNCGYLSPTYTYRFNFLNNSIMHKTEDYDEDETFYTEFTDKNAKYFVKKANLYGFFNWEESYINNGVFDGEWVEISIKFKDGSVHETYCYADFPPNYDKMADVFYEAFGYNIL